MRQITANIHVEDKFSVPPRYRGANFGFVTTAEGIVLIDTPMMPTDALKWRDDVAKRGAVRYIINTHHHIDHTTGNSFFPGVAISHQGVKELFTAPLTKAADSDRIQDAVNSGQGMVGYIRSVVREYDPEGALLLENYERKAPSITFSERLNLYVGQHTFELIHLPGHTESHIGVYIPQERVLFAGDNFTNATQPSLAQSVPLEWVTSLEKIESLDIDRVIPGHGEVCDKAEIRRFRVFIQTCIDLVKKAAREGMSREEAADRISFEDLYPGKDRGFAVHPGKAAQRRNVLRLYDLLGK